MIDVHCHLADNKFKEDWLEIFENSRNSGISKLVVVAEFESQFEKILEMCRKFPGEIFGGIGVHPIQKRNKSVQMKHTSKIEQFLNEKCVVCVGEVGLDHTRTQFKLTDQDLEEQEHVFKYQIGLAKHFGKPLNVHSRSAASRTIEILLESDLPPDFVILHAFDGSSEDAKPAIQAGFLFSVPPSFSGSERAQEVIRSIPLDLLLLETDSPALGPEKGVRNVPANAKISAELIAHVKNVPVDTVVEMTTRNARRVFKF